MTKKSTILRSLLALAVAAALGVAGLASAQNKSFDETLEVITVEVPVQVLLEGDPVRGLTEQNFEVYDGRRKQEITGFDVVDLTETETVEPEELGLASISARRHFLLLFDLTFAEPSSIARAREGARQLVQNELHPSDLVAVATYSHEGGPQLILGFTPDRRQVELAIETLGLPQLVERAPDPLGFILGDAEQGLRQVEGGEASSRGGGFNADAAFLEHAGQLQIGFDRSQRGEAQGRVLALTTSFEDLAKALNDVQGRKQVVLLSEGFDSSVILGTDDFARRQELAEAAGSGQYWEIDSEERYGSTGGLTALESMLEEFRRADAVIQAVDIGGLRAGGDARGRAGGQDSLFMMADKTGGEMIRNFNDLSAAMGEVLERTSVTYVLSFQPDRIEPNGEYHRLRVELKGVPRAARAVHRPGFYAPKPFSEKSAIERRLEAAEKVMSGRDAGVLTSSMLAAPFEVDGGDSYVPVLIEIDGPSLLAGLEGDVAALEIYVYAIAADGTVADFMTQSMGIQVDKVRPVLEAKGIKFFGDLELPPGEYTLRMLVRDGKNGRSSSRTFPMRVPEPGDGRLTLATPLFPEPGGQWLMVQEASDAEARQDHPYPFVLKEQSYMPAAKPLIPANGQAQFVLLAYNLDGGQVPLAAEFITAEGKTVKGPKISFVERVAASQPGLTQLVLALEPNGVDEGEYRLVTSMKVEGGDDVTSSIPFVVTAPSEG